MSDYIYAILAYIIGWYAVKWVAEIVLKELLIRECVKNAKRISRKCDVITSAYAGEWERKANTQFFYQDAYTHYCKEYAHNHYAFDLNGRIVGYYTNPQITFFPKNG